MSSDGLRYISPCLAERVLSCITAVLTVSCVLPLMFVIDRNSSHMKEGTVSDTCSWLSLSTAFKSVSCFCFSFSIYFRLIRVRTPSVLQRITYRQHGKQASYFIHFISGFCQLFAVFCFPRSVNTHFN